MYDIHKDKKKVEFKTANGSYTKKNQTETETQSPLSRHVSWLMGTDQTGRNLSTDA